MFFIAAFAEHREHVNPIHKTCKVIGTRQHAATKFIGAYKAAGQNGFLAGFADRFAIGVFIQDRLPHDENAEILGRDQRSQDVFGRVAIGKISEVVPHAFGVRREVLIDEAR